MEFTCEDAASREQTQLRQALQSCLIQVLCSLLSNSLKRTLCKVLSLLCESVLWTASLQTGKVTEIVTSSQVTMVLLTVVMSLFQSFFHWYVSKLGCSQTLPYRGFYLVACQESECCTLWGRCQRSARCQRGFGCCLHGGKAISLYKQATPDETVFTVGSSFL